jgi:hypothetical protein
MPVSAKAEFAVFPNSVVLRHEIRITLRGMDGMLGHLGKAEIITTCPSIPSHLQITIIPSNDAASEIAYRVVQQQ